MRNAILLVAVALVFAVGGVTYGAIRAADQTINACVEPANGQMFLMTATVCPAGQQPLSWNKDGPQGPPGIQGVQGIQGPASSAPSGVTGAASASDAVVGIVTARYRRSFATSLVVDGVGTHLATGHVHIHVDPSKWKRNGRITAVGDNSDGLLDSSITPITHGGPVTEFNVDLSGRGSTRAVVAEPQSIAPTAVTVGFHCGTLMPGTSTKFAPIFTFVRMSDQPFTPPS
jgi:hypothetical protein